MGTGWGLIALLDNTPRRRKTFKTWTCQHSSVLYPQWMACWQVFLNWVEWELAPQYPGKGDFKISRDSACAIVGAGVASGLTASCLSDREPGWIGQQYRDWNKPLLGICYPWSSEQPNVQFPGVRWCQGNLPLLGLQEVPSVRVAP